MKYKILALILLMMVYSVSASTNDCELLAKNYQDEYNGDLILIQPLKDNGAYDLGEYNGHWLNKAYNTETGVYYYDSQTDTHFKYESDVLDWYEWTRNEEAVIFNYNKGEVPFGIVWHY